MAEASGQKTINYFDRLPDEMLTKIFREFLDKLEDEDNFWNLHLNSTTSESVQSPSLGISYDDWISMRPINLAIETFRNFRENTADENLRNLCLTSKRFARVINGTYFTTLDSNQWPILKLEPKNYNQFACLHSKDDTSPCHFIKTSARSTLMRYKKLELYSFNRVQECTIQAIIDERSNLSTIIELKLLKCNISPIDLANILVALPNIKRLSICGLGDENRRFEYGDKFKTLTNQLNGRILLQLNMNLGTYPDDGHILMDYILEHLQTHKVRMQFQISHRAGYERLREYLLRYKHIIKSFHFTFQDFGTIHPCPDETISSLFNSFDYHVKGGNYEYSIISLDDGGCRRKSWSSSTATTVKYNKLEFFPGTLIVDRTLKPIEDDRDCLSEVIELNLHDCTIPPEALGKLLAFLPKIERLNICQRSEKFRVSYHFYGSQQEQPRIQEFIEPIEQFNFPDVFFYQSVHEHILTNRPTDIVRVSFNQEYLCECMSENFKPFKDYAWQRNTYMDLMS